MEYNTVITSHAMNSLAKTLFTTIFVEDVYKRQILTLQNEKGKTAKQDLRITVYEWKNKEKIVYSKEIKAAADGLWTRRTTGTSPAVHSGRDRDCLLYTSRCV